ncbi:alpha-xylosidase [Paenibacillus radicis (ex Xue et al. 2023)]|uniref:Alpha-xylosidase n=1 Tax=Paenibacillus radicis (ex Xue et al. 2023) TaxID=2972489 RepID=A0ABT1YNR1_9BACL|nr:alpha-xylosidase [Paenibacillus radicis (ex Xue et al. 2023)]MCR8634802.1 alpha-xylosidase [Paenibacillus radicis (ex Xue et al. 2023)]
MKFTDGYWHIRQGVTLNYPVEIRNIRTKPDALTVLASCKKIVTRGDTLNTAILTVNYTSPMPDVICVELVHHNGKQQKGPEFQKNEAEAVEVQVVNGDEIASFTSGKLSVQLHKNEGWSTHFIYDGKRLTGSGYKSPGHVKMQDQSTYMREQLDLGVGEYIYGLGERFTPFVKNGQVVDLWNEDGGTCSEQAYKNIPFYISNFGYGVFVDHPERVSYEVASEQVSKVQFSVPGESLKYYIIGGASMKEVLQNYTKLTGKPALPPAWSFGLWLTTSFTTSYDETTVNSFIDGMIERELPLHVFHFDCFWMKEFQWCDFQWDQDVFPDPQGMLQRLKSKGLNICVWINSYIAQQSYLFDEGKANGYLVKTKEGDVWQWDRWQGGMGLVDFTNPAAVRWYKDKLKVLVEMGVDSFKTDFGERIPTDVVYFDGSDPVKMHNYYTHLYNKAVFEVLEETKGKNEAMLFARSATAGGQQFPVHWGGDCSANYNSMAETLRGGLSLGLSGFGFWSHDIGGFENTATPDLYKRWTAFGLLSSHSRLHGSQSYRVPWLFDEEACDVLRYFTKLKSTLMPYLFSTSVEATQTGLPVMRAMVLEFMNDAACDQLDRQYMLGDSLLVAPIFNDQGTAKYYLPEGRWTNFLSGAVVEGGRWLLEKHDYFNLPLMVRPNSIIAVGTNDQRPDYDYSDGVVLHVFELGDGSTASATIFNTKGESELEVTAERSGLGIAVNVVGADKPWELILRGIHEVESIEGASWTAEEAGLRLTPKAGVCKLDIQLKL